MTDSERKREYRLTQKRGSGDEVSGDLAKDLDERGPAGETKREREAWSDKS